MVGSNHLQATRCHHFAHVLPCLTTGQPTVMKKSLPLNAVWGGGESNPWIAQLLTLKTNHETYMKKLLLFSAAFRAAPVSSPDANCQYLWSRSPSRVRTLFLRLNSMGFAYEKKLSTFKSRHSLL